MQPPCELMVSDFLPNMRALVSHELSARGESQRRISILLGITQARVSYYLSRKKALFLSQLESRLGISPADSEGYGRILASDVLRNQTDGVFTLYSIWKNLLFTGVICAPHQKQSGLSNECTVCMELHRPGRETGISSDKEIGDMQILRDISEAVSIIEASPYFPLIMPEVSVNVAMTRENPTTARDIAAIPGRINKIHGRAKAFMLPEFGSSNHMSKVLLIANSKDRRFRAAMNIKHDPLIDSSIESLKIESVTTEERIGRKSEESFGYTTRRTNDEPVLNRISKTKFPAQSESIEFALVDRGSEGLEPTTYLLGRKASEIAQLAVKIAHAYANAVEKM